MAKSTNPRKLVLPMSWSRGVRSALLHGVSLAQASALSSPDLAPVIQNHQLQLDVLYAMGWITVRQNHERMPVLTSLTPTELELTWPR